MLRAVLIATLFAAGCAGGSRTPAWPKQSAKAADGGESVAPRRYSPLAITDVPSDDVVTVDPVIEKPIARPIVEPTVDAPRPTAPTVTSPDVIINVDDIVIDIDD